MQRSKWRPKRKLGIAGRINALSWLSTIRLWLFVASAWAVVITALTSGWEYELVDGREMRAWNIKLPGWKHYVDLTTDPPQVRTYFSLRSPYRVSPYIEPEWANETP